MDLNKVLDTGGVYVPNPNYNPKKKKNKEPQFILSTDVGSNLSSHVENTAYGAGNMYDTYNYNDIKQYLNKGMTPSRVHTPYELYNELVASQTNGEKIKNSLYQTFVSELGLGTLKAFTDLPGAAATIGSEAINGITNAVFGRDLINTSDNDFSNPLSAKLEEIQEHIRTDVAPIYVDPNVDIFHGGLANVGWYAQNFPSVASSLTLLIPSKAVTTGVSFGLKALSKVAKGTKSISKAEGLANTARRLREAEDITETTRNATAVATEGTEAVRNVGAFSNRLLNSAARSLSSAKEKVLEQISKPSTNKILSAIKQNAPDALIMRTMENYQEGRQVWNDLYTEGTQQLQAMSPEEYDAWLKANPDAAEGVEDPNDRDAVARNVAKRGATKDFLINYANTGFDILQLWGIRNMFKTGAISPEHTSYTTRHIMRAMKNAPNKSIKEALDEYSKLATIKRLKNWAADHVTGLKHSVLAEGSEGIEEAVNYIAQEEGMHAGKALLGTAAPTPFDTRLKNYLESPQLWESAFWGVAGGVIFQNTASGAYRLKNYFHNKAALKENEKKTGVETDAFHASFSMLSQNTENARAIASLEGNYLSFQEAKADLEAINKDEIPGSEDENGNRKKFTNPIEKEAAKQEVLNRYARKIALNSWHNGTYNLLKEYFGDEKVQAAMNDAFKDADGKTLLSDNQLAEFKNGIVSQMESTVTNYNREFSKLNSLASSYTYKGQTLPVEFIQMAAEHNVNCDLGMARAKELAELEEARFNALFNDVKDKLDDQSIETYKSIMGRMFRAQRLYKLEKEREAIEEKLHDKPNDIGFNLARKEINKRIDQAKQDLYQTDSIEGLSANIAVIQYLTRLFDNDFKTKTDNAIKNNTDFPIQTPFHTMLHVMQMDVEQGKLSSLEDYLNVQRGSLQQVLKTDEDILNFRNMHKTSVKNINTLAEQKLMRQVEDSMDADGIQSYYNAIDYLEQYRDAETQRINNAKELQEFLAERYMTFDSLKTQAITEAGQVIMELGRIYGNDRIRGIINRAYDGVVSDTSDFSEADQAQLNDALTVLNLTNELAQPIGEIIDGMLEEAEMEDEARRQYAEQTGDIDEEFEENNDEEQGSNDEEAEASKPLATPSEQATPAAPTSSGTSSSTSQNAAQSTQSTQTINSSAEPRNAARASENSSQGQFEVADNMGRKQKVSKIITTKGDHITGVNDRSQATAALLETATPNEFDLVPFSNAATEVYSDTTLYQHDDGVSVVDGQFKVASRPILSRNGKNYRVIRKGVLVATTPVEETNGTATPEVADNATPAEAATPDTGVPGVNGSEEARAARTEPTIEPSTATSPTGGVAEASAEAGSTAIPQIDEAATPQIEDYVETEEDKILSSISDVVSKSLEIKGVDIYNFDISDEDLTKLIREFGKQAIDANNINEEDGNKAIEQLIDQTLKGRAAMQNLMSKFTLPNNANALDQTATELTLAARAVEGHHNKSDLLFDAVYRKFAKEFIKICPYGTTKVGNKDKTIVRFADMLEVCNQQFNTNSVDAIIPLYNQLRYYLLAHEDELDIVIADKTDMNNHSVIEKVGLEDDARRSDDDIEASKTVQVQITVDDTDKGWLDEFSKLERGDDVTLKVVSDRFGSNVLVTRNGYMLGRLPVPNFDNNGFYWKTNEGWKERVKIVNGAVTSPNIAIYADLLGLNGNAGSKDVALVKSLINDVMSGKQLTYQQIADFNKLLQSRKLLNPTNGFASYTSTKDVNGNDILVAAHPDQMIRHLGRLWQYCTNIKFTSNINVNNQKMLNSLHNWFEKIYVSYSKTSEFYNNMDGKTAKVSSVTEGEAYVRDTPNNKPSEAFVNIEKAHVAFCPNDGTVSVSQLGDMNFGNKFRAGRTLVVLESRNARPSIYTARGLDALNMFNASGTAAAEIGHQFGIAMLDMFNTYYSKRKDMSNQAAKRLQTEMFVFLENLFASHQRNNYGILAGVNGESIKVYNNMKRDDQRSIVIDFGLKNGVKQQIKIFFSGRSGNDIGIKMPGWDKGRFVNRSLGIIDIVSGIGFYVSKNTKFDINKGLINADTNHTDGDFGFFTKFGNKVTLKIGKASDRKLIAEGSSYSDLILRNDFITTNAEQKNGSNFDRSDNVQHQQSLFIDVPNINNVSNSSRRSTEPTLSLDEKKVRRAERANAMNKAISDAAAKHKTVSSDSIDLDVKEMLKVADDENKLTQEIEDLGSLDAFIPNTIKFSGADRFDIEANKNKEKGSAYAAFNKHTNSIYVGSAFTNLYLNDPKMAIKTIMHERLHQLLNNELTEAQRTELYKRVYDEIIPEFEKWFDKWYEANKDTKDEKLQDAIAYFKNTYYQYKSAYETASKLPGDHTADYNRMVNEFIVESFTSPYYINALNSIENNETKEHKESLFSKFIRLLCNFFGIEINDNSLFAKEVKTLEDIMSSDITISTADTSAETTTEVEEEVVPPVKKLNDNTIDDDNTVQDLQDDNADVPTSEDEDDPFADLSIAVEHYVSPYQISEDNVPVDNVSVGSSDIRINDLEVLRETIPFEERQAFDDKINNGNIKIKCN